MKRLLTILCLVLLSVHSYSQEIWIPKLVERQGIKYEINSTIPFTGISEMFIEGQLGVRGNYTDGKQDGPARTQLESRSTSFFLRK